jgi:preprotein translocase subunit Sec61beta
MLVTKVLLGVALITGLLYFAFTLTRNYHPIIADQPSVGYGTTPGQNKIQSRTITARIDRDDIVVDIETVTGSGLIRFFDPEGIQTVPIIAYVTPRGKIVTAMSISESCRSTDFFLQGNTIHCASCPSYWHMESLEAYACCQKYYPDPIASSVERGILRIPLQTVRNWRTRV